MDSFRFNGQTIAFLAIIAALDAVILLVFPLAAVMFGALAAVFVVLVWLKAGIRTRKWAWLNPVAVPLTQAEGAIVLSAALLTLVAVLTATYEATRFASGEKDVFLGYAWRHMLGNSIPSPRRHTHSVSYSDPERQQQLKDELSKASIPYSLETREGKEFIAWSAEHNAAAEEIQRQLREGPPSSGGSARFGDPETQQAFKEWLTKRGIAYETKTLGGNEYVAWKEGPQDLPMQFMKERAVPCPKSPAASAGESTQPKPC